VPGMKSGVNLNDPVVVSAFRTTLLHQGLIVLVIFVALVLVWASAREWLRPGARASDGGPAAAASARAPEPAWRMVLRIGFGLLWLLDGILQAQPQMAVGLPSRVIEPIAATSPPWVQHVVNWAGTTWSYHPLQAAASAVWIQIGIGIWMLVASRGVLSRFSGVAAVAWGLVVWVFGEAFGGVFAPGLTWLFGAPGAALIYVVAGALIALPDGAWQTRRLGRIMVTGIGLFLIGMAVLQAWPGRGFWQGTSHAAPGTLAAMTASMAPTPQPHLFATWILAFTGFDEAHGFAVNLVAVIVLAATGAAFLSARPALIRPVLIAFAVFCAADWVLIQDFGFLGGLGTDPNSMIPMLLMATSGYLAVAREPLATGELAEAGAPAAGWRDRLTAISSAPQSVASASIRSVAAVGAIGVIILGAAPMAAAQANPVASPILAQAIDGSTAPANYPAPAFSLTDQQGNTVSLASLRGKVVLMTFLDPVCTTDCPLEAQEFREAGRMLSSDEHRVELVAVVANPIDYQLGYTRAFDRQEHLAGVRNWLYLTGTLPQLRHVWSSYGVVADTEPAGSMIAHSEFAFVVDQQGRIREELDFDPGPGTAATRSSFASELAAEARLLLAQS
jgi:cytochrome oxidase Cu insertion factor (SCO1/SenC/PrrC family)